MLLGNILPNHHRGDYELVGVGAVFRQVFGLAPAWRSREREFTTRGRTKMSLSKSNSRLRTRLCGPILLAAMTMGRALFPCPAEATISISSKPSQNISCSATLCEPTATKAVLNVKDLESYLASGQGTFTVTTQGNGIEAGNIVSSADLSWSSSTILALTANGTSTGSVSIVNTVSISGPGGL